MTASPIKKKIVVIGSSNTDMVIRTPRIPRPGDQYTLPPDTLHWFQAGDKGGDSFGILIQEPG